MADTFISLSNRLLNRCPAVGYVLAQQMVNDAWRTLQARQEWSFRRRGATFAPPTLYSTGFASSNAGLNATLITGLGTNWTLDMVGRQIRIGGLLFPFYTITSVLSPTSLLIDQAWAGPNVTNQAYSILQAYYPVPEDFGFFYAVVSIKDSYRLWTNLTEADLAMMDPQRTNFGQTYAVVYKDYTQIVRGAVGPVMGLSITTGHVPPSPISITQTGFAYPAPLSYLITVVGGGTSGTATFTWNRVGLPPNFVQVTAPDPIDLEFGVQIYWPDTLVYEAGTSFLVNANPGGSIGVPRYELWPAPTFNGYLYPYIYIAKESDLTVASPQLPPFIANRGEVLLEMALEKCAEFPGADAEHRNIYYDLKQAIYHGNKVRDMLIDLERNDEEVGVRSIDYENYPFAAAPWMDGQWQQTHAPFLNG